MKKNDVYMQKIKKEKMGHGLQFAQEEKHHCICMNKIWIHKII